ncbi:MAG TPA: class IV adenylate cyclase [Pyrinomonadaceae bacterium]
MAIEVEKKYRLTRAQYEALRVRLLEVGAEQRGEVFEENTIYGGGILSLKNCVLRLRRAGAVATLAYKERFPSDQTIKRQLEEETRVEDPEAAAAILDALGYRPALVYEKRRATWQLPGAEVAVDELPFGLFLEIEGDEDAIISAEQLLGLTDAQAETATYPYLTRKHGKKRGQCVEARFEDRSD